MTAESAAQKAKCFLACTAGGHRPPPQRVNHRVLAVAITSARATVAERVNKSSASTRGILLRRRKLSDTSLIVSWCTDSLGVIQTVARGARRPKSPFRGRLDLFFEAEIAIALSRKSTLHTLREVTVINPFAGIRTSHVRTQAAAYFVELVEICTERDHHEPEIFALLQRGFGFLDRAQPDARAIAHFENELARITGVRDPTRANGASQLGHLFGKLPRSRAPLLHALRT